MPHRPGLRANEPHGSPRLQQSIRYDNLAAHMAKLLPGIQPAYIRRTVASSRLLNKDGSINEPRAEKYARSLGGERAVNKLPKSRGAWGAVVEGESP